MQKPGRVFDRQWEWGELARFASDRRPETTLGIVWGRRRQGKSLLLSELARVTRGFYYQAIEGNAVEILRDLSSKFTAFLGTPAPLVFQSFEQALGVLLDTALRVDARPAVVVLDEFPLMAAAYPALPSLVRNALGLVAKARRRAGARLILCGSAVGFMSKLLGGEAPLRGRAGLELVVSPFDFRAARRFWRLRDPALAVKVFSVVGGTPAYRREFVADDAPRSARDFDAWVTRTALNPAVPLFREPRYLLSEDPSLGDRALYHSVLAAIAAGETTSARIAGRLGRPATSLAYPLQTLTDAGFITSDVDAFHAKRVHYSISEPLLVFYDAIARSAWSELERPGQAREVWRRSQSTFLAQVVGPQFEAICRTWARRFASARTIGGPVRLVTRGLVPDAEARTTRDVDVVALGEGRTVRLLGEAKWGERMTSAHVEPLRRARDLLARRGFDLADTRLACFAGAGFDRALQAAAARENLLLVDLRRLYGGS
jgi:uncharacterized protein